MIKQKPKKQSRSSAHYPIKLVVRRTGLSGHLIRMWERRYDAVTPLRTDTNRRVYTDAEVRRLEILGKLTRSGHTISAVANLATDKLEKMLHFDRGTADGSKRKLVIAPGQIAPEKLVSEAVKAVAALDAHGLKQIFLQAEASLGQSGMLRSVISPFLEEVGKRALSGKFKSVNENLATAISRGYVGGWRAPHIPAESGPTIIAATLQGDWHEHGALSTASVAASNGWSAVYLGPSLTAEELSKAVHNHAPELVALSVSAAPRDNTIRMELEKLPQLLGKRIRVVVIGDGAKALSETIQQIDATRVDSISDLPKVLATFRK